MSHEVRIAMLAIQAQNAMHRFKHSAGPCLEPVATTAEPRRHEEPSPGPLCALWVGGGRFGLRPGPLR